MLTSGFLPLANYGGYEMDVTCQYCEKTFSHSVALIHEKACREEYEEKNKKLEEIENNIKKKRTKKEVAK